MFRMLGFRVWGVGLCQSPELLVSGLRFGRLGVGFVGLSLLGHVAVPLKGYIGL